jgi:hypothetical protein
MTRKLEVMVLILYKVLQSILKWPINFLQLKNHLENYYFQIIQHVRKKLRP